MLNAVISGAFGSPVDESDACGIMKPADGAAFYGERIPAALAKVKAMRDEELGRTIDLFGMMQLPAVNLLLLALKHSKVPGIYGPSGDSQ